MYYFPKIGIFFTLLSILLPIISHLYNSDVHQNPIDLYKFSFYVFIIFFGVPINIIVNLIKKRAKRIQILEKNLGTRLLKEASNLKDEQEIEQYNEKNKKYLDYIKKNILETLQKEQSKSLSKLKKINKELENQRTHEKLKNEIIKKHPFVKKIIPYRNR